MFSSQSINKRLQCCDRWEKFFYQPIKNDQIKHDSIRKIAIGQINGRTTGCLLDYIYFKEIIS